MQMDQFEKELAAAVQQRSDAWRDARCGKFTSSEIWKLMTDPRSKSQELSDTARQYILTKVAEEISGVVHQGASSYPLVWGEEQEPVAREYFEKKTGLKVELTGFVIANNHYGGSPDGIVPQQGIIEIKCPYNPGNHVDYLMADFIGESNYMEYYWQMQSNMLITSTEKCFFIAFDPRFDEPYRMKVIEVRRNDDDIARMTARIERAVEYKLRYIEILKSKTL